MNNRWVFLVVMLLIAAPVGFVAKAVFEQGSFVFGFLLSVVFMLLVMSAIIGTIIWNDLDFKDGEKGDE